MNFPPIGTPLFVRGNSRMTNSHCPTLPRRKLSQMPIVAGLSLLFCIPKNTFQSGFKIDLDSNLQWSATACVRACWWTWTEFPGSCFRYNRLVKFRGAKIERNRRIKKSNKILATSRATESRLSSAGSFFARANCTWRCRWGTKVVCEIYD